LPSNSSEDLQGIVLSFDYGLRQIGLAVGETITKSGRPRAFIKASSGGPVWKLIEKYITEYQPAYLVVGLPLNMDGSESEMSARADKFSRRLHGRFGLQVFLQDERLSSNEVKQGLREGRPVVPLTGSAGKKAAVLNRIDDQAAALILQSYFSSR